MKSGLFKNTRYSDRVWCYLPSANWMSAAETAFYYKFAFIIARFLAINSKLVILYIIILLIHVNPEYHSFDNERRTIRSVRKNRISSREMFYLALISYLWSKTPLANDLEFSYPLKKENRKAETVDMARLYSYTSSVLGFLYFSIFYTVRTIRKPFRVFGSIISRARTAAMAEPGRFKDENPIVR